MLTALEKFSVYAEIWCLDRDEELQIFMKEDPRLSEFEAKILHYKDLEQQIVAEEEHYAVGPIALRTGTLVDHDHYANFFFCN